MPAFILAVYCFVQIFPILVTMAGILAILLICLYASADYQIRKWRNKL
jgi:hypothetical protein